MGFIMAEKKLNWALVGNLQEAINVLKVSIEINKLPRFVIMFTNIDSKNETLISLCNKYQIAIYKRDRLSSLDEFPQIDFLFVARYTILPASLLNSLPLGAFNMHYSLLPFYRGVHPISWAIVNGEQTTGVTIHLIDAGIDTGPIFWQKSVNITNDDTIWTLTDKLHSTSIEGIKQFFSSFFENNGKIEYKEQPCNNNNNFYARRRTEEDGIVNLESMTFCEIHNLVRALQDPLPLAFIKTDKTKLKILKINRVKSSESLNVGQIIKTSSNLYLAHCKDGTLEIITKNE